MQAKDIEQENQKESSLRQRLRRLQKSENQDSEGDDIYREMCHSDKPPYKVWVSTWMLKCIHEHFKITRDADILFVLFGLLPGYPTTDNISKRLMKYVEESDYLSRYPSSSGRLFPEIQKDPNGKEELKRIIEKIGRKGRWLINDLFDYIEVIEEPSKHIADLELYGTLLDGNIYKPTPEKYSLLLQCNIFPRTLSENSIDEDIKQPEQESYAGQPEEERLGQDSEDAEGLIIDTEFNTIVIIKQLLERWITNFRKNIPVLLKNFRYRVAIMAICILVLLGFIISRYQANNNQIRPIMAQDSLAQEYNKNLPKLENSIPVEAIQLLPPEASINEKNNLEIEIMFFPENATDKYVFCDSSDINILTAYDNGAIEANSNFVPTSSTEEVEVTFKPRGASSQEVKATLPVTIYYSDQDTELPETKIGNEMVDNSPENKLAVHIPQDRR